MPRIGGRQAEKLGPFDAPMSNPDEYVGEEFDFGPDAGGLPTTFEMDADGNVIEAANDPEFPGSTEAPAGVNIAETLSEDYLTKLGSDIVEKVERDNEERSTWRDRFERGLSLMGLVESDLDDGPFPGASSVVHPLITEAVTQFWGRAMGELFPAAGPAKGKVMGAQTKEKLDRAERVAEYINYELTHEDEEYIDGSSRLLFTLPLTGCAFRKTYRDLSLDRNVGVFVPAEDIIVPSEATNLRTSERYTHRMRKSRNELLKLQLAGFYRDIDLQPPQNNDDDEILKIKQETQDLTPDQDGDDAEYELFETNINLDIPGFEHVGDDGLPTGLELPYAVTVDRHSRRVLSIYAAWKAGDKKYRRRVHITKYGFVPGFGFYDLGLFHLIGGLQAAATGALRVLLDSAASASLSGGFVSKNANLKGKTLVSSPGEWQPVDASSEDLQKAFFPLPVKEPSPALFNLLALLIDGGKSFTATTDAMAGKGDGKNVAVGTIEKLIEQGEKVMSTIHRMAHRSLGEELGFRYELAGEFAPEGGYPYDVSGQERSVYKEDFTSDVSVVPISDPNIFSSSQRLAISQMVYEVGTANPDKVNRTKAIRRLFEAARVPDIDDLVPDEPEATPYDPNGEIQAMLMGKPIMVIPEQPHDEHLKVLWAFASNPQYGGNKQVQMQIGSTLLSTIGQHLAYAWATHSRALGAPVGYMDPGTGQMAQPNLAAPEQIAAVLALVAPQLATVPGLPPIEEGGEGGKDDGQAKMMEAQIKADSERQSMALEREKHQQNMQMKLEEHAFKLKELEAKMQAKLKEIEANAQIKQQQAMIDVSIQQQEAEQRRVMNEQQMQLDQETMQRQAMNDQQQMDQQAQMSERKGAMEMQQMARDGQMRQAQASQDMQLQQQKAQQPAGGRADRNAHLR